MRIMPGQAITFMTYEWVSKHMHHLEDAVEAAKDKSPFSVSR